jgi:succinate dehydrogenase / fumarate reductase membrane anchor subunit
MFLGNQSVSPVFFWFSAMAIGLIVSYACALRLRLARGSLFWKMQRLSGALLFVLVPAHMLFMHLNHSVGRDVQVITERLNQPSIAVIDGILLILILYHGGYGLVGILKDYLTNSRILRTVSGIAILILVVFGLQGLALLSSF